MLRTLVLILLVLNAAFFCWSQGWLKPWVGVAPDVEHDPKRLQLQVHADQIVVLPAGSAPAFAIAASAASSADGPGPRMAMPGPGSAVAAASPAQARLVASSANPGLAMSGAGSGAASVVAGLSTQLSGKLALAASTPGNGQPHTRADAPSGLASNAATLAASPGRCLEAGPVPAADLAAWRTAIGRALPAGAWTLRHQDIDGEWWVYMGPYPNPDLYERKLAELHHIRNLNFEEITSPPALAHGLALGRYTTLESAQTALETFKLRGIHTARVLMHRTQDVQTWIQVGHADTRLQELLHTQKWPGNLRFGACIAAGEQTSP